MFFFFRTFGDKTSSYLLVDMRWPNEKDGRQRVEDEAVKGTAMEIHIGQAVEVKLKTLTALRRRRILHPSKLIQLIPANGPTNCCSRKTAALPSPISVFSAA